MREGKTAGSGPESGGGAVNDAVTAARTAAYAEVYRTRDTWLLRYATSLTGSDQAAADLVAETHFRVWRRLRGGDPVDNLPAFLTTTLRGLAAERGRAQQETASVPAPDRRISHVELLSRLLRELPERWVTALWCAEVEDLRAAEVGARINADASGAGVVLGRARDRLRQAFLQSQPGTPADEACAEYWKLMPSMVRDATSARRAKHVTAHTASCADCRERLQALTEANSRLPVLLGPTLLVGVLRRNTADTVKIPAASAAKAMPATALMPASVPVAVEPAPAVAPRTGAVRTGSKSGARHARVSTGTVGQARTRAFTKSISPAKGVLVGSVGVVGIAAAATALALGTAAPHHAAAVGATTATSSAATAAAGETAAAGAGDGSAAADPTSTAAAAAGAPTASAVSASSAAQSPQQSALPASQTGQQVAQQAATGQASAAAPAGSTTAAAPGTTTTSAPSTTPATAPSSSAPTTTQPTTSAPTTPSTPPPSQTSSSSSSPTSSSSGTTPSDTPSIAPSTPSSSSDSATAPSTTATTTDTATAPATTAESPAASDSASAPAATATPDATATSSGS